MRGPAGVGGAGQRKDGDTWNPAWLAGARGTVVGGWAVHSFLEAGSLVPASVNVLVSWCPREMSVCTAAQAAPHPPPGWTVSWGGGGRCASLVGGGGEDCIRGPLPPREQPPACPALPPRQPWERLVLLSSGVPAGRGSRMQKGLSKCLLKEDWTPPASLLPAQTFHTCRGRGDSRAPTGLPQGLELGSATLERRRRVGKRVCGRSTLTRAQVAVNLALPHRLSCQALGPLELWRLCSPFLIYQGEHCPQVLEARGLWAGAHPLWVSELPRQRTHVLKP